MVMLSILIPTVVGADRFCSWNNLLGKIFSQSELKREAGRVIRIGDYCMNYWQSDANIEVISCFDEKQLTIGEKRELLYKEANGLYSWQIDDDDDIAPNAIELILEAIKSNPEIPCITFRERCMINGQYKSSNHSIKYPQWMDNNDGYDFVRCAFYKDVIRTDIAKSVPFPHIRYNEDEQWSMAIKPFLADEIHIDQELYHYIYNETNHQERYGLDRSS